MPTKLLVGIGNPGEEFGRQRHNIGFRAVDEFSKRLNISYKYDKKKAVFGKKKINGLEVITLKPQTFANLSGEAVLYIASFLKVNIEDVFVVYDEISKKFGHVDVEPDVRKISHSAIEHLKISLNNDKFTCLSMGVGPLPKEMKEEDFYLENFSRQDELLLPELFDQAYKKALEFLNIGLKA